MKSNSNNKNGFTLFYAMLVSSVLLAIGLSIFNIVLKDFRLSAAARDSHFSFYSADSGVECALFYDFENGFPTSTSPSPSTVYCSGENRAIVSGLCPTKTDCSRRHSFTVTFPETPYCARVDVFKFETGRTEIESRGYNFGYDLGQDNCSVHNPNKVERAIRVTY